MNARLITIAAAALLALGCWACGEGDAGQEGGEEPPIYTSSSSPPSSASVEIDTRMPLNQRAYCPEGPVGSWIRARITEGAVARVEEWAIVGEVEVEGQRWRWLEHVYSPQDSELREVSWRLITPAGEVKLALRGEQGAAGKRVALVERPDGADWVPWLELPDAERKNGRKAIPVGESRLSCSERLFDGGEAWVSEQVAFGGLVQLTAPADGYRFELLAHGGDRERQLSGPLPAWPAE